MYSKLEDEVLELINEVRTDPTFLIEDLNTMLSYYNNDVYRNPRTHVNVKTSEGRAAVVEAIEFLKAQDSMNRFYSSRGLVNTARCHADDIGRKGLVTRRGSDGSLTIDRIERFGKWTGSCSESLSFGELNAKDTVLQWIIGDGNKRRGDRRNIFKPDYLVCGVGVAWHAKYELVVSMVFVSDFDDFLDRDLKNNILSVRESTYSPGRLFQNENYNIENAEFSRTGKNVSWKSPTKVYYSPDRSVIENEQYESFKAPPGNNSYDPSYKFGSLTPSRSIRKPALKEQEERVGDLKKALLQEESRLEAIKQEYSREAHEQSKLQVPGGYFPYETEYRSHYQKSPSPRRSPSPYMSPYNLAKSSPNFVKDKHWNQGTTSNYEYSQEVANNNYQHARNNSKSKVSGISDIYYNAKPWERDGGHEYAAKVLPDGSIVNWGGEYSWPTGAVKCDEVKKTRMEGNKAISSVIKNYTMQDGSVQTHEYSTVDKI